MSRQKKYSTKGALHRDDSDDELGNEDYPWEWIYQDQAYDNAKDEDDTPNLKKRKASAISTMPMIIGATMGSFKVKIGDAVLLKSPEQGKDWVGLVCAFFDTNEDGDEEKCVHIQWFCAPEELSFSKRARTRPEVLPNESYITADFNINPLTAINGKAKVLSKDEFFKKYPGGAEPKSKTAAINFSKTVMCRRGVKQRTMQFTEEFVWDQMYSGPEDLLGFIDWIREQTKGRRKQETIERIKPDLDHEYRAEDGDPPEVPKTPSKRRKTTSLASTPKSSVKSTKFLTPSHKRIVIKKPLEITPLGTRILSPSKYLASPYAQARTTLHVSSVPSSLPCRTNEFSTVYNHLHAAISDGTGACIYISGTPGTGKTATVREVVGALHAAVLNDELDDFDFVEINGMKVTEPYQSYSLLWEALKGDRVSPSHALSLLEHEFSHPSPRRIPCVVLMDELDQLVTKSQSVMYNFFNWPTSRHSRLIVLAVANTMDLPERTLSNKVSSRLDLTRITFPGYTHTQLMEIITSRLEGVPGKIVDPDAVQFAARKVAAVSGDARRALDICRRAVEIAEQAQGSTGLASVTEENATTTSNDMEEAGSETPSRKNKNKLNFQFQALPTSNTSPTKPKSMARVTIATIKAAINEVTSSPIAQHLRSLPLSSKLFLAALLARSRRSGVAESMLGDVLVEAKRIADMATEHKWVGDFLLVDHSFDTEGQITMNKKAPTVLGMGAAAMDLVEAGIVIMELRNRGERAGKVRLRVSEEEVKSALMGDIEVKGMGFDA